MTVDTAIAVAAIVLVLLWPTHQQLTIRALRHAIRQQHKQLHQHRRAIVQLQGAAIQPPASVGQPMPTVTKVTATISGDGYLQRHTRYDSPEVRPFAPGECVVLPADTHIVQGGWVNGPMGGREDGPELFIPHDPDRTLRLARPPALSDIEHVLTQAGRALTATELAAKLDRQPWDLIAAIDCDTKAGRIKAVPGHTAGRTAYALADPTERMPHGMSVLPGVAR